MFVGGRCRVHRKLQLGTPAVMEETILSCREKQGSAGAMTLLTVGYRYSQRNTLCLEEERDFMYLPARDAVDSEEGHNADDVAVPDAELSLDVPIDSVLLFKFSALTFNGHRIHYDADYAREVEGYPDSVVHGPLTALLLAGLATAGIADFSRFSFRARAPLFCGDRLRLRGDSDANGDTVSLTAYRPDGRVAMTAEVER
jgi:3-methylfumaryl-CoA hydratase